MSAWSTSPTTTSVFSPLSVVGINSIIRNTTVASWSTYKTAVNCWNTKSVKWNHRHIRSRKRFTNRSKVNCPKFCLLATYVRNTKTVRNASTTLVRWSSFWSPFSFWPALSRSPWNDTDKSKSSWKRISPTTSVRQTTDYLPQINFYILLNESDFCDWSRGRFACL